MDARAAMDDENVLGQVAISIAPGEVVTHTVVVYVVERLDSWFQEVRFSGSEHTGNILQLGMLAEALELAKLPDYPTLEEEGEDE